MQFRVEKILDCERINQSYLRFFFAPIYLFGIYLPLLIYLYFFLLTFCFSFICVRATESVCQRVC